MSAGWTNYSVGNSSHGGDDDRDGPVTGDDVPACSSCKKRKLRCSRETPTCSHCIRLVTECVYQPRQKPGLKPGAVEALARRVAFLEQILLDTAGNVRPQYELKDGEASTPSLTQDQNKEVAREPPHQQDLRSTSRIVVDSNGPFSASPATTDTRSREDDRPTPSLLKRKFDRPPSIDLLLEYENIEISKYLPSQPLLEKVVDFFCVSFHHWIPYIHKQRIQTKVREGYHDPGFDLVLHALVAVCLRHMSPNVLFLDRDQIVQQTKRSRLIVETHSIRSVSVESLQALIFIVFDLLNDGQNHRAWPLIGSLTRTIDYLQLTTEPSASHSGSLMAPVRLMRPSVDWTEQEERRRLFWVIFLLDRFCSSSTGWNTSLTADDVHRRLPADGGYFTREEPVITPFFGIWNKAVARIGRSLANVPAQYNEDDAAVEHVPGQGASPSSASGYIDASKLGAFAYCVEATESLSQVTTFFLQQRINWQDKQHAVSWLTRFKEIDLRLVQWKLFLPPRWKDSNISSDRTVVDMDPNLTLAHLTHNTSMILLHHPIAYPPRAWNDYVALPKDCSAQTCELAAIETSNIVSKFLAHSPIPFVNIQFSFCTFVAAKALLFEFQATRKQLRPEFQRLTLDLWEMSRKWKGQTPLDTEADNSGSPCNQAGVYAQHLERLYEACQQDPQFRFDFYDHAELTMNPQQYVSPNYTATPQQRTGSVAHIPNIINHARQNSINSTQSVPSPGLNPAAARASPTTYDKRGPNFPASSQILSPVGPSSGYPVAGYASQGPNIYPMSAPPPPGAAPQIGSVHANGKIVNNPQSMQDQSLLNLSDTFMDSHFLDMDRVITFEDANFYIPGDAFRWQ